MKKGFERLRHIAVASSMGLGLLGGGSARAATAGLAITRKAGSATWKNIKNTGLSTSSAVTIQTSSGFIIASSGLSSTDRGFAINKGSLTNGLSGGFSGALYMGAFFSGSAGAIFKNPDGTVDLTGDTLTTDLRTDFITGINAQIEYLFHPTRPLVRALYSFTNNTNNPLTFNALIGGNLGSGNATIIQASSDGNNNADASDLWLISNNKALNTDPSTGDTPVVTISRFGTGATVSAANGITLGAPSGTFGHRYTLTVAANSTARILVFAELNKTIADAKACAKDFETLDAASSAGLLSGFTVQLNEIVNYAAATGASVTSTCIHTASATTTSDSGSTTTTTTTDTTTNTSTDSSSSSSTSTTTTSTKKDLSTGALDLASLTTLLGLLGLSRVRKKESS